MIRIITSEPNIRYFSGFSGSVALLIERDRSSTLIVDGRYTIQARAEAYEGINVVQAPLHLSLLDAAVKILKKEKVREIGYEDDRMTVESFNKLKAKFPGVKFRSISGELRGKRMVKNKKEIDLIRKAALIADLTYDCMIRIIKAGMTELEISAHIDYLIKTFKGDLPSFETLVSSGKLSAHAHGKPSGKKVKKGDHLVMDFGAKYKGYNSDITRMASIGTPSKKVQRIYDAVLKAQLAAIAKVRAGAAASAVDLAARDSLKKDKLDKYFDHATGHGVGLQVHEGPRVSLTSRDILKEGMVITIEPGVYISGFGGFRVEDMVLVTKGGCEILTKSPKELAVI
jgi:Xaa-Pro aminopeptidase